MKSTMLMALAQIKRRREQSLLVAVTLVVSALLFVTALVVVLGVDRPFEQMYREQRASHLLLQFDARIHDPNQIAAWWGSQEGVVSVTPPLPAVMGWDKPLLNGRELASAVIVAEHPGANAEQDLLRVVQGAAQDTPGRGELWIPTALAHAESIEVGDTLELPTPAGTEPLVVSAIVIDPQFSNIFTNPTRAWVRAGALPHLYPVSALNEVMVGVRLDDPGRIDRLWRAFGRAVGQGFSGTVVNYDLISAAHLGLSRFIGGLLLAIALLALAVALFVIYAAISGSILADYRLIGVLKTLGFTGHNLRGLYLVQYGVLSLVSLPLGIALGSWTGGLALNLTLRAISVAKLSAPYTAIAVITFTALLVVVAGTVLWTSRAASRVQPVQALRFGGPPEAPTRATLRGPGWRRLPLTVFLAAASLLAQPRRALTTALGVVAAAFVLVFSINLVSSFAQMGDELARWGFDSADVRLMRARKRSSVEHHTLMAELAQEPGVRAVLPTDMKYEGSVPATTARPSRNLLGTLVDGDWAAVGFECLRGSNPTDAEQIALAPGTARDHGVSVGDSFELLLAGQRRSFTVSGIYQSVQNLGQGFRLQAEVARQVDPLYQPHQYSVVLEAGADRVGFIQEMEARYGEALDAEPGDFLVASIVRSVVTAMAAAFGFVSLIFLLASAVSIANSTLMDVREQRRSLGVLKTLGMTPRQLRAVLVLKAGGLALVGGTAGLAVGLAVAGPILTSLFANMGMVSFPLDVNALGTALTLPLLVTLCGLAAWIASRDITHIDARTLIAE